MISDEILKLPDDRAALVLGAFNGTTKNVALLQLVAHYFNPLS